MRKCRKIQVIKSLFLAVFLMTITSVYASETRQNKELPIYIGREKKGAGVKVEQVEKQIWAHVADYQEEDLRALIEELKGRSGEVYLSLYGKNLEEQQQVQAIYSLLFNNEELKALTDLKLHFVYTPLDEKDILFKGMPFIKVLNMHVDQEEDQKLMKYLNDQYGQQYELILTDELATHYGQDVAKGLDAAYKIYYDLPFEYKHIDKIFRQSKLGQLPVKYSDFYAALEEMLQVNDELIKKENLYEVKKLSELNQTLRFTVRTKEPVDYIEYKVNDAAAGQSFRYPYPITLDEELLHKGINEVKVVMKLKGKEQYHVQNLFIDYKGEIGYQERAARKGVAYPISQKPVYKKGYIPTLMYHKIKDQVENTEEDQSMSVSTANFEAQLKALLEAGYTPINFKQLQDYLEGKAGLPKKPILITADDGYLCNYTKAYPILKKYNAQATFFVTSLYVGITNEHEHFSWEQAKEMEASGLIDIQSHTHGHTLMNALDKVDVSYEIQKSFGDIEKYLGKRDVKVLAYPQFLHTSKVKEWASECGVDLQVTNLVSKYRPAATQKTDIKRIHVSNDLSPQKLLNQIKRLTE
ncbi:MAG: polysaccharide deacetylase family protein [Clostridiales bacterium]|nr:polysaccharide deacetylase family protein [Clostridiales bacterium]MDU6975033.1 polysaccharide deacetylase family protein [Clostridiales bacterium]